MMELYVNLNPESKSTTLISRASYPNLTVLNLTILFEKTKQYQINFTPQSFH